VTNAPWHPILHEQGYENFSDFLERHYDGVFKVAWRVMGDRADAEDLAQDVCFSLARKIASYRGEAPIKNWLCRVVANAARDKFRRLHAEGRARDEWGRREIICKSESAERDAARQEISEAMRLLDDEDRLTVALMLEGLTQAEIGQALDLAPGTVAWRMSGVKQKLRSIMEEEVAADAG